MTIVKLLLLLSVLLLLPTKHLIIGTPDTFKGKVISIKDGDTIELLYKGKALRIRLAHIDCLEIRKGQPFGRAAKLSTADLCFGQMVEVLNDSKFDRYKRLIGVIINAKGQNVNKELVRSGMARHFKMYSNDQNYAALENEVRAKHTGLWKDKNPIPPWEWRHHK